MSPLPAGAPLPEDTLLQGKHPGPITHSLGHLFRGDRAVRSFRCHLSSPACHQDGLEQSPANLLLAHLHHLSSTELSILLHRPQVPGQHRTNLTQAVSPEISTPGWYLLHHQADLAPLRQRGRFYSPYFLPTHPKGALQHCSSQGLHRCFWSGAQSPPKARTRAGAARLGITSRQTPTSQLLYKGWFWSFGVA